MRKTRTIKNNQKKAERERKGEKKSDKTLNKTSFCWNQNHLRQ